MSWNGNAGRIVFWRQCVTSPSIAENTWVGPTGFSGERDDLPDQGKGTYSSGALPITGMGMVDIVFAPTFSIGTSERRMARVLLNGVTNIGFAEQTSGQRTTVAVVTVAFVKPGDVLSFEVFQRGVPGGLGLETGPASYISVLSR